MSATYEYITLELARGREAWATVSSILREKGRAAIVDSGAELVGMFSPQLGFASNEAQALLRWRSGVKDSAAAFHIPEIVGSQRQVLTPTMRPKDDQALKEGGIYVHRWFTIDGDKKAEFIDLSNRAWGNFEGSYDTEIFGLFTADTNDDDRKDGAARLLLLTWYRDHGVWEASREQARDAQSLFALRHLLTRSTVGRSSLRVI